MHPIERLRHLARSSGYDQRVLVGEAASALRALRADPAGLVISSRRIVERHPSSGPLWWMCAHLLTAHDPGSTARELTGRIELDPTPDHLAASLPEGATVCVLGWPDLAGEAVLQRGDLRVLAIDTAGQGSALVRRIQRAAEHDDAGVDAEVIDPAGIAAAVLSSDLVLVEASAASLEAVLAVPGSRAAATIAADEGIPVWAVVGVGRRLPAAAFDSLVERVGDVRVAWDAEAEVVPLRSVSHVVCEAGVVERDDADMRPECPLAHELLG